MYIIYNSKKNKNNWLIKAQYRGFGKNKSAYIC